MDALDAKKETELHDFTWVMKQLLAGQKVRRETWNKQSFLWVDENKIMCYDAKYDSDNRFMLYVSHIKATDWVLYE